MVGGGQGSGGSVLFRQKFLDDHALMMWFEGEGDRSCFICIIPKPGAAA